MTLTSTTLKASRRSPSTGVAQDVSDAFCLRPSLIAPTKYF